MRGVERWLPDLVCRDVHAVPWEALVASGVRAVVLDLDNTLGPWGLTELTPHALALLTDLRERGLQVGLLSNAGRRRRARLEAQLAPLGIPLILRAGKPLKRGFLEALRLLGASPERTVMVGDQWLTDVVGAKRLGLRTVLVAPVDPRSESRWTRARRRLERRLLRGRLGRQVL